MKRNLNYMSIDYISLWILRISENTPIAVTSAPALILLVLEEEAVVPCSLYD